tara:strand:+ start:1928 stop:2803 length:876 start_codon:yes stop_codon:yes gene_type:complete
MKKIFVIFLVSFVNVSAQELFIQGEDQYKGSIKVDGQEYITVYDNTNHIYRYYDVNGNEIFLIKSYNEKNDQIGLSIEKNSETKVLEIIIDNIPIAYLVNSVIYDFDNNHIGQLYRGEYNESKIKNFWQGIDYSAGNISIYDHTGVYKVGSLEFKQEVDKFEILGFEKPLDFENLDERSSRKVIRNLQKYYRKLVRSYKIEDLDVKKSPEDKEVFEQFMKVSDAYESIMGDLGVDKDDEKILGIIPSDYFSQKRRTNWSNDEGYVPYTKRQIKSHNPDTKIQKDQLYNKGE